MKNQIHALVERASQIASEDSPRRRVELVERAVGEGHTVEFADMVYDLAEEESVDPAFAFELVLNGIGVRDLAEPNQDGWLETQVEAAPEWVTREKLDSGDAARERHMRTTFRRLRRVFEEHATPEAALRAFAAEPDVGEIEY